MYLVPKQNRICCVHIGMCILHVRILHIHIYTHSYMYDSTYIHTVQLTATSCSHTHLDLESWLDATGYFHVFHSVHQQQQSRHSFSELNRKSRQEHSQLLLKSHTKEWKKVKTSKNINLIESTATSVCFKCIEKKWGVFSVPWNIFQTKIMFWSFGTETVNQSISIMDIRD